MKDEVNRVYQAISKLNQAKSELRKLGVLRSERTTGEFGEWFAEQFFEARRASSTSQIGWDLESGGVKYQVKTHAKGDLNNARWTEWKYEEKQFDFIIILVFTKELKLKEAYRIHYEEAVKRIDQNRKQVVLKWDNHKNCNIINEIRLHPTLKVFCEKSL